MGTHIFTSFGNSFFGQLSVSSCQLLEGETERIENIILLNLDIGIRNSISSFAKIDTDEIDDGLLRLREYLDMGVCDREYGHLRQQKHYDVGYRFIYNTVA
ncbi:MAG: hypothetical protein ACRC62_22405 [Microcoleus sp.]